MAATWHQKPMLAFDTETTGIDVEADRIVTVTTAAIRPGQEPAITSDLIAVDIDIPEGATRIHGITTEHARTHGQPTEGVLAHVAGDLALALTRGVPVVGMNLVYDFTILDRNLRRYGIDTLIDRLDLHRGIAPVIDVFVLDKHVDPYRPGGRKLADLCAVYGVRHDGAHDATQDALAAARIVWRIASLTGKSTDDLCAMYSQRKFPRTIANAFHQLGELSVAELHAAQVGWFKEQADSLRAHFDKKGTAHDGIPVDWPMRPYVAQGALL